MFITELFTIGKNWRKMYKNREWYIHSVQCHAATGLAAYKLGLIGGPGEGGLSVCFPGLSCIPNDVEAELREVRQ